MKQHDVGALPVVSDLVSKELVGIVTDRDLCISPVAEGKNPRTTKIEPYITKDVITCSPEDTLEACEQKMSQHKVRRLPVVGKQGNCIGMIAQADIARNAKAQEFQAMVAEISRPSTTRPSQVSVA
jgi:CBS domain-containing protein